MILNISPSMNSGSAISAVLSLLPCTRSDNSPHAGSGTEALPEGWGSCQSLLITVLFVFRPFHIGQLYIIAQSLNHTGEGFIDDRFLLPDHAIDVGGRSADCLRQLGLRRPSFDTHDLYIDFNVVFDRDPCSFDS